MRILVPIYWYCWSWYCHIQWAHQSMLSQSNMVGLKYDAQRESMILSSHIHWLYMYTIFILIWFFYNRICKCSAITVFTVWYLCGPAIIITAYFLCVYCMFLSLLLHQTQDKVLYRKHKDYCSILYCNSHLCVFMAAVFSSFVSSISLVEVLN